MVRRIAQIAIQVSIETGAEFPHPALKKYFIFLIGIEFLGKPKYTKQTIPLLLAFLSVIPFISQFNGVIYNLVLKKENFINTITSLSYIVKRINLKFFSFILHFNFTLSRIS